MEENLSIEALNEHYDPSTVILNNSLVKDLEEIQIEPEHSSDTYLPSPNVLFLQCFLLKRYIKRQRLKDWVFEHVSLAVTILLVVLISTAMDSDEVSNDSNRKFVGSFSLPLILLLSISGTV